MKIENLDFNHIQCKHLSADCYCCSKFFFKYTYTFTNGIFGLKILFEMQSYSRAIVTVTEF